ncbi:fructose-6-phosphate aldolase [Streptococcus dentasini]
MEFMLDTVNLKEIEKWAAILPLAGVTSNPSIVKKEGNIDFFEQARKIREIIGEKSSFHAQVVAADVKGIIKDAHKLRNELGGNLYIKIPVSAAGLAAMKELKKQGFNITATAIYSLFQGLLAIEADADYLAPYYNRMENLNTDSEIVITQLVQAIQNKGSSTKILAASFKNVAQMNKALTAGAHAVTASGAVYESGLENPSIQKAVDDFTADWKETQGRNYI